uniref:Uncharacterized protein n=1 Tax=Pediococcus pentosaceus TaxID=1255 RepID=Q9RHE4_PEDPE|nr:unknown [Pediococcus pentosaceus]
MVSTDLSFLFANKTAETLGTSGTAIPAARQENNKTSVKCETLALFGQNSP